LEYNYSLGITAWLDPLAADYVLRAYKMLADRGELTSEVVAFPRCWRKILWRSWRGCRKAREAYKEMWRICTSRDQSVRGWGGGISVTDGAFEQAV